MHAKSSRRPPGAAASANDAVRDRLRAAGLRCTPARLAVMQRLAAARGPRTHAELAADLAAGSRHADSGYDKATIYRNLVELTQAGLVSRIELGDHVWRFELRGDAGGGSLPGKHPHFVCTECGGVSCLDGVEVALKPLPGGRRAGGGRGDGRRIGTVNEVLLKGRCDDCS